MIAERERSSLKQFLLLFKILMALTSKIFFLARSPSSVDLPDPRYSGSVAGQVNGQLIRVRWASLGTPSRERERKVKRP